MSEDSLNDSGPLALEQSKTLLGMTLGVTLVGVMVLIDFLYPPFGMSENFILISILFPAFVGFLMDWWGVLNAR